jgi:hypothetical protein
VRAIRITTTAPPTPTAAMHGVHLRECVAAQVRAGQLAQGERGVVHADGKSEEGGEHGLHGATPAPHSRHAQCCHDVDLLRYMMGRPVERVSSFGKLTHFTHVRVMEGGRWEVIADAASLPPPPPPRPSRRLAAQLRPRTAAWTAPSRASVPTAPCSSTCVPPSAATLAASHRRCSTRVSARSAWRMLAIGGGGGVRGALRICVLLRVSVCAASAIWRCVMAFVRMSECVLRGPARLRLRLLRNYSLTDSYTPPSPPPPPPPPTHNTPAPQQSRRRRTWRRPCAWGRMGAACGRATTTWRTTRCVPTPHNPVRPPPPRDPPPPSHPCAQVVNLQFEGGATATLTTTAFTQSVCQVSTLVVGGGEGVGACV